MTFLGTEQKKSTVQYYTKIATTHNSSSSLSLGLSFLKKAEMAGYLIEQKGWRAACHELPIGVKSLTFAAKKLNIFLPVYYFGAKTLEIRNRKETVNFRFRCRNKIDLNYFDRGFKLKKAKTRRKKQKESRLSKIDAAGELKSFSKWKNRVLLLQKKPVSSNKSTLGNFPVN